MTARSRAATLLLAVAALAVVAAGIVGAGRAFIDRHVGRYPGAWRIVHDWRGDWETPFAARTVGADGLRVRIDGAHVGAPPCFETHDAELVRGFLGLVRIDASASGTGCMHEGCCGGEYAIDVLQEGGASVSFTLDRGRALRSGQLWPGDARLTGESAEAVCAWLVAHGVNVESPREEEDRLAALAKARDAAQDDILGREHAEALRACADDPESIAALLARRATDATDRIVLAVRFLAIDPTEAPGAGAAAHEGVERWLRGVENPTALAAAFAHLLADDDVASEAARRFEVLDRSDDGRFPAVALPALRRRAGLLLLASSSDYERACGVQTLGRIGATPEVRTILLGLLPPVGGDGRLASSPTDAQLEAAVRVAEFCDPSMFPRLEALADAASYDARWTERMARRIEARRDATHAAESARPR